MCKLLFFHTMKVDGDQEWALLCSTEEKLMDIEALEEMMTEFYFLAELPFIV